MQTLMEHPHGPWCPYLCVSVCVPISAVIPVSEANAELNATAGRRTYPTLLSQVSLVQGGS